MTKTEPPIEIVPCPYVNGFSSDNAGVSFITYKYDHYSDFVLFEDGKPSRCFRFPVAVNPTPESERFPIPDDTPEPLAAAALVIQQCTGGEYGLQTARKAIEAYESKRSEISDTVTVRATIDDQPHHAGEGVVFKLRYLEYENDELKCSTGPLDLQDCIVDSPKPVIETALANAAEILANFKSSEPHTDGTLERKLEEWQACYAKIFTQMNELVQSKKPVLVDLQAFEAVFRRYFAKNSTHRKAAEVIWNASAEYFSETIAWHKKALAEANAHHEQHHLREIESAKSEQPVQYALEVAAEILNNFKGEGNKLEEWQACYAKLFTQMNELVQSSQKRESGSQWLPIETAPKDGSPVYLWMKEHWSQHWNQDGTPSEHGETRSARIMTDCWWSKNAYCYRTKTYKEGWAYFKEMYLEPEPFTHWMPKPVAPTTEIEGQS